MRQAQKTRSGRRPNPSWVPAGFRIELKTHAGSAFYQREEHLRAENIALQNDTPADVVLHPGATLRR